MLAEAGLLLIAAKLVVKTIPFRLLAQRLGPVNTESAETVQKNDAIIAAQTGWAVGAIARRISTLEQCLLQALAAHWMLSRRGVANTLYFGVHTDEKKQLLAHAWLRVGDRIVVGGKGRKGFHVIATFGAKSA